MLCRQHLAVGAELDTARLGGREACGGALAVVIRADLQLIVAAGAQGDQVRLVVAPALRARDKVMMMQVSLRPRLCENPASSKTRRMIFLRLIKIDRA